MVLEEHLEDIHFLKVDVEGAELQVLSGINLKQRRPWIILVEATKPNSQEQDFDTWEHLIIERGYVYRYFDGLNRFYVAQERTELMAAFDTPPNVYDDFLTYNEWSSQTALKAKEAELQNIYNSRSFRITAPMRVVFGFIRNLRDRWNKFWSRVC